MHISVKRFHHNLIEWYDKNHRPLPWRETKNPYYIWISEIMLQQTQVKTVYDYYLRFIKRFPNVEILANTTREEVLKYWEGLGYYNRAVRLHQAAKIVKNNFQGNLPSDYLQLLSLPGIGQYTAGAISSIAFHQPMPAIDGNVSRVICRLFLIREDIKNAGSQKKIKEFAMKILSKEDPGTFNQAIMELGATTCFPRKPGCNVCPVKKDCRAFSHHQQGTIPRIKRKPKQNRIYMEIALVINGDKILMVKRPSEGLLANLWALPSIEKEEKIEGGISILRHLESQHEIKIDRKPIFLGEETHTFTHRIWRMKLYYFPYLRGINPDEKKENWCHIKKVKQYPIGKAFKKMFKYIERVMKKN